MCLDRSASTPKAFSVAFGDVGRTITNGFGDVGFGEVFPVFF
jgi:hypothetical protein